MCTQSAIFRLRSSPSRQVDFDEFSIWVLFLRNSPSMFCCSLLSVDSVLVGWGLAFLFFLFRLVWRREQSRSAVRAHGCGSSLRFGTEPRPLHQSGQVWWHLAPLWWRIRRCKSVHSAFIAANFLRVRCWPQPWNALLSLRTPLIEGCVNF